MALTVIFAALAIGVTAAFSDSAPITPGASGGLTPSALAGIASNWASANGESNPRDMMAVATDRQSALAVVEPGTVVVDGSNRPVYAITTRGNFVGYEAHIPAGLKPPDGSVLKSGG